MFAVVSISGKQYTVKEGDTVLVDKITGNTGDTVTLDRVLLTSDGKKTSVGTPTVPGGKVKVKILSQEKGEYVEVRRYKSKVRYRRQNGYRAQLTRIQVMSIV